MSPKSLFFLVAVGLCATQMVSANREAGGLAKLMNTATAKLTSYMTDAESPIRSSINTVKNYIVDLENRFLESGTKALNKAGINVDLKDVANLVKGKINVCANNDNIKSGAMAVLDSMATCITKDVASLKNLVTEMDDLWVTAQNMPNAIGDITARCQSDKPVAEEPLKLTLDTSNHELAAASNELLQTASKHVSKRALGGLMRMARCAKSVFDFAKSDLVVGIPGDVMSAATSAFQIMKSVQGGIPACVALKATENVSEIAKLGLQVQSCMATGLTDAEINNNPSLKALKQLSNAAVTLSKLQSGGAMKAAAHILG